MLLFLFYLFTGVLIVGELVAINNLLFILLHCNLNPDTVGTARIKAKEREKKERRVIRAKKRKGVEAQRAKPLTPTQANNAHMGDEEQDGNRKKTKTKKRGAGPQPGYPGPFGYLLHPYPTPTHREKYILLFYYCYANPISWDT